MYCCKFLFLLFSVTFGPLEELGSQGNCLIYEDESGERKACELSYAALEHPQGSAESQRLFDEAIKVGPKYAWAYYEKSVPYFKRGLFAEGVSLINEAIALEPSNYLDYRAYWYFYNRSYENCIQDLEALFIDHKASYRSTPGGDLEMRFLLAMAHAHTGNLERGIYWAEEVMRYYKKKPHLMGNYDYFCLGILYYHSGKLAAATSAFEEQLIVDDRFANTYYYLGLIKEEEGLLDKAQSYFKKALKYFNQEDGGYTRSGFTEYDVRKEDVLEKISAF